VDGERLVHLWDVPHLFKNVWTNWFENRLLVLKRPLGHLDTALTQIGSYEHFEGLFKRERNLMRLVQLSHQMVYPTRKCAMKESALTFKFIQKLILQIIKN